jgi:periplasmic copper chaperone A
MKALVAVLALVLAFAGSARAQSGGIDVTAAWARATAGASAGGAFMTIANKGPGDDQLIGASTPVADYAGLHEMRNVNGVMTMSPVPALEIKAGGSVTLAPGGYHLMLTGLKEPLKAGESFRLTLVFAKAGKIEVTVQIGKAGASGPDMGGMIMN